MQVTLTNNQQNAKTKVNQMISNRIIPNLGILAVNMAAADSGAGSSDGGMGNMETETGFLSLAALAGADTDGVQTLLSRVPTAGVWQVRGEAVKITQGEANEKGPGPFRVGFVYLVMGGKATDPDYDSDKMIDRKLRESTTIWPSDIEEGIGLLKGRYQKAGIDNKGAMGGVEGMEPGWVDNFVTAEFEVRIRHGQRNGDTVAYYDWQPITPPEDNEE